MACAPAFRWRVRRGRLIGMACEERVEWMCTIPGAAPGRGVWVIMRRERTRRRQTQASTRCESPVRTRLSIVVIGRSRGETLRTCTTVVVELRSRARLPGASASTCGCTVPLCTLDYGEARGEISS